MMKQKILILMLVLLCSATATLAQKNKTVNTVDIDAAAIEAVVRKHIGNPKYEDVVMMMANNYQKMSAANQRSKSEETVELSQMKVKSSEVTSVKIKMIGKNTAIVTSQMRIIWTWVDGGIEHEDSWETNNVVMKKGYEKWIILDSCQLGVN